MGGAGQASRIELPPGYENVMSAVGRFAARRLHQEGIVCHGPCAQLADRSRHELLVPGRDPSGSSAQSSTSTKCIACQTCTPRLQDHVDERARAGVHAVEQRRDEAVRLLPRWWDLQLLDQLGPQTWENGRYTGRTVFEAAPAGERVLGWTPHSMDLRNPNVGEDEISGAVDKQSAGATLPQQIWMSFIWRGSVITAHTRPASRPAHARPSTSVLGTASWCSTRSAAAAIRSACALSLRRSTSIPDWHEREVHRLLSEDRAGHPAAVLRELLARSDCGMGGESTRAGA